MPPRRVPGDLHTFADPGSLLDAVQREVQIVDPKMAATEVQTIGKFMSLPMFAARARRRGCYWEHLDSWRWR